MSDFAALDSSNLAINELVTHVKSIGGLVSNDIEFIHNEETGTGVFAKSKIPAKAVLIYIPFQHCISVESVMTTCISEIVNIRPGLLNYPDEIIAMGLMYFVTKCKNNENNNDNNDTSNQWIKHVNTIPSTYNTPIYWNEAELNEIKGCNTYHLTNLMKKQIAADWIALHQPLSVEYPEILGEATIELYQWALSTVYSRGM